MSELTNRIDKLLLERRLKRIDLVRGTGINESTIRSWIRGAVPSAEAAFKVAQYFGVTVEYLVSGNNLENAPQFYISPEEAEIIDIYRSLDRKVKVLLVEFAKVLDKNR